MKILLSIIILFAALVYVVDTVDAVDMRQITVAYKEGLSQGWINKIEEGVMEMMGQTNAGQRCVWIGRTNELGELWHSAEFWAEYQFTNINLQSFEAEIDKKIPKPFRGKIVCFYGVSEDGGLFSTNKVCIHDI